MKFYESLRRFLFFFIPKLQFIGMLKSVQSSDYIKYSLAAIERGMRLCSDKSKEVNYREFKI